MANCLLGVIFFKKQELNPKEYISLAKNWGNLAEYPMLKGNDNYPEICYNYSGHMSLNFIKIDTI